MKIAGEGFDEAVRAVFPGDPLLVDLIGFEAKVPEGVVEVRAGEGEECRGDEAGEGEGRCAGEGKYMVVELGGEMGLRMRG